MTLEETKKHIETEVLEGLKEIATLADNVWMGRVNSRLDTVLEINRIAEKLIEKVQEKMIDNNAKTTAADKVITREPTVIEKHSFNLPKPTGFTFHQLLCLNDAHTKAEIARELLWDAASCYDYLPVSNELAKKAKSRLEQITQEIADLNRELYNFVNTREEPKQ